MKLVSACLVGINCRYDGKSKLIPELVEEYKKGNLLPVCPEVLGGLPTPRDRSEIVGGGGLDVIKGRAKVMTEKGEDVTEKFIKGAEEVLKIARERNIKEAIFARRSPSCGCGEIYDGTFSRRLIKGDGVTTALLKEYNIRVVPY